MSVALATRAGRQLDGVLDEAKAPIPGVMTHRCGVAGRRYGGPYGAGLD